MILQPDNVELTKVHYYDKTRWSQNMSVSTISREIHQNNYNKNILVKNNVFGHKWVLRINQEANKEDPKGEKRRRVLVFLCVSVFLSVIIALFLGVVLSLDFNIFRVENKNVPNLSTIRAPTENYLNITVTRDLETANNENQPKNIPTVYPGVSKGRNASSGNDTALPKISLNSISLYCRNCTINEICFKTSEIETPKCVRLVDKSDPTGCGGLCKINTQFCKNLDKNFHVYQCLDLKNRLQCPENTFNCENMCVSLSKTCDGRADCSNLLDEKNCECNLETHFQCGNQTSCLERNKYCNGKVDCWDKSDEIMCLKDNFSNTFCEENFIPCLNGQCIPKEKLCDNVFDCSDRTDEPLWCQQINRKK